MSAENTEVHSCDKCSKSFDSQKGLSLHETRGHGDPWHDEEKLRQLYVEQEVSSEEMARRWGCDAKTVRNNLDRYGIERRSPGFYQKKPYAKYSVEETGYCNWWDSTRIGGGIKRIAVHRLLAVTEYGFDAVAGNHVHHQNGVKWDNRPDNITVESPSEHAKSHLDEFIRSEQEGYFISPTGEKKELTGELE